MTSYFYTTDSHPIPIVLESGHSVNNTYSNATGVHTKSESKKRHKHAAGPECYSRGGPTKRSRRSTAPEIAVGEFPSMAVGDLPGRERITRDTPFMSTRDNVLPPEESLLLQTPECAGEDSAQLPFEYGRHPGSPTSFEKVHKWQNRMSTARPGVESDDPHATPQVTTPLRGDFDLVECLPFTDAVDQQEAFPAVLNEPVRFVPTFHNGHPYTMPPYVPAFPANEHHYTPQIRRDSASSFTSYTSQASSFTVRLDPGGNPHYTFVV